MTELPLGWINTRLSEICAINPRVDKAALTSGVVSFVPMPAVEAETGNIDVSETRDFETVKKGYKPFREGDILFAKITPCMENGEMAIVPELASAHGFDSTEFHVLRPSNGVDPRYIYHAVSNRAFRFHAKHRMTGAVGQKRVPVAVLEEHEIGLPPQNEQRRIVEKVEAMFDEIDKGVESLRAAKSTLELYRKSSLKAAFEGRLTADWRAQNPDKLEDPDALLDRIHEERQARDQAALEDWEDAVAEWRNGGEKGRKPAKPKEPNSVAPLEVREIEKLPDIPNPWAFIRMGLYINRIEAGKSFKCLEKEPRCDQVGVAKVSAVTWGEYDETESKTCLDDAKINENLFIREGDFLLSRANTIKLVGASVNTEKVTKRIMISDKTLRIHFMSEDRRFFLHYLRSPHGRAEIESRSTSNQESMRNIGQDRIKDIIVPICSLAEKTEIVRILGSRLEAADRLDADIDAALARAAALRQSTLNKAFSGRLIPQDPDDEPALAFLKRIKTGRASANTKAPTTKKRRTCHAS